MRWSLRNLWFWYLGWCAVLPRPHNVAYFYGAAFPISGGPMTAPTLTLQQRIHDALFEQRCARHSLDCDCRVVDNRWCTRDEKIRQQSLDRLLDRITPVTYAEINS